VTEQIRICPIHEMPLTYSRKLKRWYCKDCLYGSFLTHQAQQEATKRYRQTEKGKEAAKRYEQSEKGKEARHIYLHSEKYKQRRREYNQRLKESLRIARAVLTERATKEKEVEKRRTAEFLPLIQDIREYLDSISRMPTTSEVVAWANDTYEVTLTHHKAADLIKKALRRH